MQVSDAAQCGHTQLTPRLTLGSTAVPGSLVPELQNGGVNIRRTEVLCTGEPTVCRQRECHPRTQSTKGCLLHPIRHDSCRHFIAPDALPCRVILSDFCHLAWSRSKGRLTEIQPSSRRVHTGHLRTELHRDVFGDRVLVKERKTTPLYLPRRHL